MTSQNIEENLDTFADYICGFFKEHLIIGKFPYLLKYSHLTLVFKKGYRGSEENYIPITILHVIFTVRFLYKLLYKEMAGLTDQQLCYQHCYQQLCYHSNRRTV